MAIVDVHLADGDRGLDLVPELRARQIRTFGLSGHGSAPLALEALNAGCRWFYEKTNDQLHLLVSAVANALRGELDEEPVDIPAFWPLSPRLVEIASMEYHGLRTENIAARLEIAEATVRRHRGEVLAKTGIPYWESVLAFLRAWQTPRPPHRAAPGASNGDEGRNGPRGDGSTSARSGKRSKRQVKVKASNSSQEGE